MKWDIYVENMTYILVALNSKRFTLDVYFKRRRFPTNGGHVFAGMWQHLDFFLHDLIEVCTKRLVPIDLLHIPDLILKLYVFSLNFIENKKFASLYNINILKGQLNKKYIFSLNLAWKGTLSPSKREITLEKSTILESKWEMCKWSFWPLALRF